MQKRLSTATVECSSSDADGNSPRVTVYLSLPEGGPRSTGVYLDVPSFRRPVPMPRAVRGARWSRWLRGAPPDGPAGHASCLLLLESPYPGHEAEPHPPRSTSWLAKASRRRKGCEGNGREDRTSPS